MSVVLVVDDDQDIREMLCQVMMSQGYTVIEAENGEQALQMVECHDPDLVITDIVMPRKEGLELISELKTNNPSLKVIAFSGGGKASPENYLAFAKGMGADAVFSKPVPIAQLQVKVMELLASA